MSHAMKTGYRAALGCMALFQLAACGGLGTRTDGAAPADTGICGTHADPGILKLTGPSPAIDATVANQAIVHGFTIVGAPADFTNFDLRYGPSHTAGLPTPANPRFHTTVSGSDVIYQLTIDSWARAPGHVEFSANGGYDTKEGCTWNFPSPLFSYDLTAGPDGGTTAEAGGAVDGYTKAIDAAIDGSSKPDIPESFDLPAAEVAGGLDGDLSVDSGASLDGVIVNLDAAIDGAAGTFDATID
jgi:hypothetical protein